MKTYAIRYYIVEKIEEDWMFYFWCSTTSGGSDAGAVVLGRSRYTVTLLTALNPGLGSHEKKKAFGQVESTAHVIWIKIFWLCLLSLNYLEICGYLQLVL